jgi:hypothetical protein
MIIIVIEWECFTMYLIHISREWNIVLTFYHDIILYRVVTIVYFKAASHLTKNKQTKGNE